MRACKETSRMKWQKERVARGADYKRHVREGESGDNDAAEVRCLSKECRRKIVLDFAKRAEMSVVNTPMKMRAKHKNRVINEGQLRCKQPSLLCTK